ncbi:MAG: MAPEG family protein [Polyangiales bacterium]
MATPVGSGTVGDMNDQIAILGAVIGLALWSHAMWAWMYATRLPAIHRSGLDPDPHLPRGVQMATLPSRVRWKSDNYTNLMEQPTVFYAVAITLAVLGEGDGFNLALAWAYVGIRVAHSLLQATINRIPVRFCLFALSSITLIILTVRAALVVL